MPNDKAQPRCIHGQSVNLYVLPDKLRIELTDEGRADVLNYINNPCAECGVVASRHNFHESNVEGGHREYQLPDEELLYRVPQIQVLAELMEDHLGNGWEMPDAGEIGALTSSPLIAWDVSRDDEGNIDDIGALYWFPNYQIESELETLIRRGFVEFTRAPTEGEGTKDADLKIAYKCETCGFPFTHEDDALKHRCKGERN